MQFRIIKVEVSGMKGIEKPMTFQFLNDTIDYKRSFVESSIKAIYGLNGSGKSSFITAIEIYKRVCTSYSYLVEDSTVRNLNKLINAKEKVFKIKVFYISKELKITICHEMVINNAKGRPFIEKETVSRIIGKSINSESTTILICEGSNLVLFNAGPSDISKNLLKKALDKKNEYSSALAVLSDVNFVSELEKVMKSGGLKVDNISKDDPFLVMLFTNMFVTSISVFLDEKDRHVGSRYKDFYRFLNSISPEMAQNPIVSGDTFISRDMLSEYKKQVDKMAGFIKLFKPELKKIDIDKRPNGQFVQCRLVMNYGAYSIDFDYESTGLRNLMDMFTCLDQASRGGVAFIDEMDANMNEVYLSRLCEFFVNHAKGQLCFTTHNTAPMRSLQSKKFGIDFINSRSENYQWIRNGNYSPSKLYAEGMIPGIPFNLDGVDFIEVFSSEEK